MIPSNVRDGLKTRLQTITGLRVYDLIPDTVTPPAAIVGQLDFTFDLNNARGLDQANCDVLVIVQRLSERVAQDKLDAFLAGSGAGSIKTAIEADKTLSGAVQTLRVVSASPGTITSANIDYLSYQYAVELIG